MSEPKYKVGQIVTYICDTDKKQYSFKIAEIREDCIDDGANPYTTFVYYDGEGSFLAEEDIEGVARESIEITEDSLIADGWEKNIDFPEFSEHWHYDKAIDHPKNPEWKYYLSIQPMSNTLGRDWYLHVDNNCFESVGTMDVANFGQIDKFIELLSE